MCTIETDGAPRGAKWLLTWRPPLATGGHGGRPRGEGGEEVRRNPVLEAADIATELLVREKLAEKLLP